MTIKVLLHFRLKERVVHSIGFTQKKDKLEFVGLSNSRSLRASAHTGVAIPRIDVPPLVEEFQKTAQKNGLYDDRMPEIRRRFPHQSADWFGMTVLFDAQSFLHKFRFVAPQNDTERVRVKTITDHARHDLAARPAGKFQFVSVLTKVDNHKPGI